jgi:two-component system sensor histidine kinase RegB
VPLAALLEDVALPHRVGNIQLALTHSNSASPADEWISIRRKPEFLHGVGNVLQNAFQFAKTTVGVDITTTPEKVGITIWDDGPGFSTGLLQKIGEPYISTRAGQTGNRQNGTGGHMGLGVFIAKTLLERTGARVNFANRPEGGARITLIWPRTAELFQVQGLE